MGSRLVSRLTAQGHTVRVLTRDVNKARGALPYGRLEFFGPADWGRALAGATAVVNLAGEPINQPAGGPVNHSVVFIVYISETNDSFTIYCLIR